MAKGWKFGYALCILLLSSFPLLGQVQAASQIEPIPIPGGDILPPLFNQFFPGVGAGFDGLNADPHGITNFRGFVAMGTQMGRRSTITAPPTASSRTSVCIRGNTWEGKLLRPTPQARQSPQRRTAPSSRYELTSTPPVWGAHKYMI
jgi:hypothetical protein